MNQPFARKFRLKRFAASLVVLLGFSSLAAEAKPPLNDSSLVGTWVNVKTTRGVAKIVITSASGKLSVHPFGACSPTLCDWGDHAATAFSSSSASPSGVGFNVTVSFSFDNVRMQGHLITTSTGQKLLEVTSQTQFTDRGDTRFDYEIIDDFKLK